MTWINQWRKRIRTLLRREQVERELDEELAFHLEMETEKNVRAGMTREEARRQAALTFGARERFREEVRDARWVRPLLELTPDVKLALRMLVKHPALSVVGGLGMAVAIALAAGFYTFMAGIYYSVPPLEEGDRIVALDNALVLDGDDSRSTLFDYHAWRGGLRTVTDVAAFVDGWSSIEVPGATPTSIIVARMTASGFRLARVAPLLGRPILDEDEREGAAPVLVIGYDEWRRDFGGDASVVGREVRLEGMVHTIVGVMPEGFRFPSHHGYWTALSTNPTLLSGPDEGPHHVVFARLAPGVDLAAAQAEAIALHRRLAAEYPETYELRRPVVGPYARAVFDLQQYPPWQIWLLQLFAALVLTLIAVNVAVLVYARTASRHAELTVRTALGASRRRIVTQLFLEALVLSGLAAVLGLVIAQVGLSMVFSIPDFGNNVPYWISRTLPASTILYSAGLAVLAAFVVGAVPGLQATGRHLQASLRQMGGGTGIRMGTTWTVLIVTQVAIAVAVLPAVVAISWSSMWAVPPEPTFPANELLSVQLAQRELFLAAPASEAQRSEREAKYAALQAELIRELEAEPGIAGVTYSGGNMGLLVASEPGGAAIDVGAAEVDVRYFDVLGVRLLSGRRLQPGDRTDAPTSVVVSRAFAEQVFGGGPAVGRQVWVRTDQDSTARSYEIVGVVEDLFVRSGDQVRASAMMYIPTGIGAQRLSIAARVRGVDPVTLLPRAMRIGQRIAPEHNVVAGPMFGNGRAGGSDGAPLSLAVGLITTSILLLSMAGVSAMMSLAVTRRQREIGIRSALGAPRLRIVWAIFAGSARQIGVGLVAGAAAAVLVDRLSGGEMLNGQDVLTPLVAGMMALAGLLATLGPARRALRVEPMEALRAE
jgi:putative ABC transport system permease protein